MKTTQPTNKQNTDNAFQEFFGHPNYIKLKNHLFNYLNRKYNIEVAFRRFNSISNSNILDIGSGISPVSPIPQNTLFLDVSSEAVAIMKQLGYNAHLGDITALNLDTKFDWIFCSEVLEHVPNYQTALEQLTKNIKPDGKILITVPVYQKYWDIDDEYVSHQRRFEPLEFEANLKATNLNILYEKPIGNRLERYLTIYLVKKYKNKPANFNITGRFKTLIIIFINQLLFLLSILISPFNTKKDTSIMLYVCRKNIAE